MRAGERASRVRVCVEAEHAEQDVTARAFFPFYLNASLC